MLAPAAGNRSSFSAVKLPSRLEFFGVFDASSPWLIDRSIAFPHGQETLGLLGWLWRDQLVSDCQESEFPAWRGLTLSGRD
jgi:hypothetical protein